MGVIHIENVDEKVLTSLKLRARISGRSLEDEIRALLAEAAKPRMSLEAGTAALEGARETRSAGTSEPLSPQERAAVFRRAQAMTPKVPQTDSTEIIRELRDRGYAGR